VQPAGSGTHGQTKGDVKKKLRSLQIEPVKPNKRRSVIIILRRWLKDLEAEEAHARAIKRRPWTVEERN
jgi:hypothetical protein